MSHNWFVVSPVALAPIVLQRNSLDFMVRQKRSCITYSFSIVFHRDHDSIPQNIAHLLIFQVILQLVECTTLPDCDL